MSYKCRMSYIELKPMRTNLFSAQVSILPCVNCDDSEIESISLGNVLTSDKWRAKVEEMRAESDPAKRKTLKDALPCFTPSGTFSHVSAAGLIEHSGCISVDIDYKPEKGINNALAGFDLKRAISGVPYVAYCGHSCSGAGYVLIIPIADPTKHREYFRALAYHFKRAGLDIDKACKDISRKRFVSWDADPYINTAARPWAITLPELEQATRRNPGGAIDTSESAAIVEAVIKACNDNECDITKNYDDWAAILADLAIMFGDNGREYAHKISALHPNYSENQTDTKFSDFLKHPEYEGGINNFLRIARKYIPDAVSNILAKMDFNVVEL